MALAASEIKHGMIVAARGVAGQWEVLDRRPRAGYYWLHRWNGSEWEATYEHQRDLHRVADGSRHEYEQMELEAA